MTTKTDELREIFLKMSPVTTFTDRQETATHVGDVPSEHEIEETLTRLVGEMRERFPFQSDLDDETLVDVVRGFYAGESDADMARELGVDTDTVTQGRLDVHLFRPADSEAPFDLRQLLRLVEAGSDDATCAAELDVSESTVRSYRRILEARQHARCDSYHYPLEFESLLDVDTDEELSASLEADRELFAEIKD
ncbi:hypothetical protein SAMN04487950_0319 [Halogranum rubrum]|uniref:Conditioned medium-induced protein 4 n=2 Tax=Halogranum rubrum TaxID=553466 RepID=A0A1I4B6V9_9EURY|nr:MULTISPECIES: hypothetical protein [Halogranum]EJN58075.1 hypothetical protein HSB1_34920 [Halogranum salarium B-1]SFK63877.1 hypothetical protein SAMN04487950_0319 [Halogranum rubrum]